ncbi:hypothetical protein [Undibacterium sp. Xuan67W]|uniref:hypothetical protein n=1 Tax=Undibacterium sp. Xuan67W TaxID=3413057 RepID=UPI003BF1111F
MTLSVSLRQKQAVSNARKNDIDAASSAGKMLCYAAPRPTAGGTPSAPALCTFLFTDPCGTVDASGLHLTVAAPAQVVTGGDIDWCRIVDGDGNYCNDGNVRMPSDVDAATADYLVDRANVLAGGFVVLVSALIAEGG